MTWLYAYIFTVAGVYDSASPETQVRAQWHSSVVQLRHRDIWLLPGWVACVWDVCRCSMCDQHTPLNPRHVAAAALLLQKACTTSQSNFNYILSEAPWFRVPYPGQWGSPIFTTSGAGAVRGRIA